jgi:hypothetical protein
MTKKITFAVLAVALLGLAFYRFEPLLGASGETHYQKESFMQGLFFGTTRQANLASDGSLTTSGALNIGALTQGGATLSLSATSTLTASQLCSTRVILMGSATNTPTITLPAASATNAVTNCLDTTGDFLDFVVVNRSTTSSLLFAAGSGDTIYETMRVGIATSTTAMATSSVAQFRVIRDGSTTNLYLQTKAVAP